MTYIKTEDELCESIKEAQIETGSLFQSYRIGDSLIDIGWDGQTFLAREAGSSNVRMLDVSGMLPLTPAH